MGTPVTGMSPARLRDLARRASTFKYGFGFPDLGVIDPDATIEEVEALEDAEMLVRETDTGEPERWRLRHATLKDVIYASLPKRERERLHQLLAQNLLNTGHPSLAADHLELAIPGASNPHAARHVGALVRRLLKRASGVSRAARACAGASLWDSTRRGA